MAGRWASFDCYGTLVDWDGGVGAQLARLFGADAVPRLLARYHEVEPELQAESPTPTYRDVLTRALEALAAEEGGALDGEAGGLWRAVPTWPAFPEVRAVLEQLRANGWSIAVLSNTDPDFLDASLAR